MGPRLKSAENLPETGESKCMHVAVDGSPQFFTGLCSLTHESFCYAAHNVTVDFPRKVIQGKD